MDRERFSAIAHSKHLFCSPISPKHLAALLSATKLGTGLAAVDYGCGNAGMAVFIANRHAAVVDAVERSPWMLRLARGRTAGVTSGEVRLHACSAHDFRAAPDNYDLALAVGVDALFGGSRRDTLLGLRRVLRSGGHALFGETYWRRRPAPDYLNALGVTEDVMGSHADNIMDGERAGFRLVKAAEASEAEWDDYEGRYAAAVADHLAAQPDEPDAESMRVRSEAHSKLYRQQGRSTLGFGFYLLQRLES